MVLDGRLLEENSFLQTFDKTCFQIVSEVVRSVLEQFVGCVFGSITVEARHECIVALVAGIAGNYLGLESPIYLHCFCCVFKILYEYLVVDFTF